MDKFEWVTTGDMMAQLQEQLNAIHSEEIQKIGYADSTETLDEARRNILGKKGRLSGIMKKMGGLTKEERPLAGKAINQIKEGLQAAIDKRAHELKTAEMKRDIENEYIDITLPGIEPQTGSLHPLTITQRRIEDCFLRMGFKIEHGPDIEDYYHNFQALNFPEDHPALDLQDTFYLNDELLLRTHTSPVQIRAMSVQKPPLAFIVPGKVYRCDADVTHSPMFHQIEGFMVDENIRFSDLKGVLEAFIHEIFGPETPYRLRPHYFPFTEPSAEVDILFERRHPNGHMVKDWMEILGAGMIHPNVLENCNIDPDKFSGFAFGLGVDRIAMLKYGINALSHLLENDM
ncbi:MAG: phenylalanine--tRNA ligase subunit alpha, partial [Candidatus Sumerlaeota bacterium]